MGFFRKKTSNDLSACTHKHATFNVAFSNRPFGVKRFQTDVAHGLVLLFGIGTKALVWGFFSQEV